MSQSPSYALVVEVTRGFEVESTHRGAIAAVDSYGHLHASVGQADVPIYVRSCAKPFQALAFVCSGAADAIGATEEEIAIACSSHSGEPQHQEIVRSLMKKAGVTEDDLACGPHPPFDRDTRDELRKEGKSATPVHHNCSGKHTAMLATAKHLDLSTDDYTSPEHGVQLAILGLLASLAGLEFEEIGIAVDGCRAPAFYLPLRGFSLAMARLAAEGGGGEEWRGLSDEDDEYETEGFDSDFGDDFPVPIAEGMSRIWQAMVHHPILIAGRSNRLCTDLMQTANRLGVPLVAKSGAEGAYAVGVVHEGVGLGLTFKIEDGAQRARDAAVLESLFQLGILPDEARGPLVGYHQQIVQTNAGDPIGEVRPCFRLSRGLPG